MLGLIGAKSQSNLTVFGSDLQIKTAGLNPISFPSKQFWSEPKIWYTIDTLSKGVDTCQHEFISSDPYSYARGFGGGIGITCAVMHSPGTRCSWTIQTRKSICKKCLMHIVETDENPNPPKPVELPKPIETYETLLDKINKKQDK